MRDRTAVKIPTTLESAIDVAVTRHLEAELGARRLLLSSADLAIAESKTAALGRRLTTSVLQQCYPKTDGLTVEFERTDDIGRIGAALAFGAVTSRVLASGVGEGIGRQAAVELLCGTFNLAIGLVDGICDGDAAAGEQLLAHFRDADLIGAAKRQRCPGWLHAEVPIFLAADDGVAFTVSVIEAFFETLHTVYGDNADVRRIVGEQLADALRAEIGSVRRPLTALSAEHRIECSRATSVLPFEIIETMTTADRATSLAGTMMGEALWRIDDLVDLVDDARVGALNAVLLDASGPRGTRDGYEIADLHAVLASTRIDSAAAEAAERLRDGLRMAGVSVGDDRDMFLLFVQRYAGIEPLS